MGFGVDWQKGLENEFDQEVDSRVSRKACCLRVFFLFMLIVENPAFDLQCGKFTAEFARGSFTLLGILKVAMRCLDGFEKCREVEVKPDGAVGAAR